MFEQIAALPAWITAHWVEIIAFWGVTVTIASVITAATPTPRDDAVWARVYGAVEKIALVFGRAKAMPGETAMRAALRSEWLRGHGSPSPDEARDLAEYGSPPRASPKPGLGSGHQL